MKPIGPLMWEHRLIEQMVVLLRGEIDRITSRKTVNVILVEQAVDFFRTYADRTHHGKEEDILFRRLEGHAMPPHLVQLMEDVHLRKARVLPSGERPGWTSPRWRALRRACSCSR